MEPWLKKEESIVFDGKRKVMERLFTAPDGRQVKFQVKLEEDVALVFALDQDQNVILVRQFRTGPESITLEVPAGRMDPGEESLEAARRELLEETGYTGTLQKLYTHPVAAYSTGKANHFIASNCVRLDDQHLDQNEFIEVLTVSLPECRELLRTGKICGMSAATIYSGLDHLHLL